MNVKFPQEWIGIQAFLPLVVGEFKHLPARANIK